MTDVLTISEVARRSGVAPSALRFYEAQRLIHSERNSTGHRRDSRSVLRLVAVIGFAQKVGRSLNENPDYSEWQQGRRSIGGLRKIGEGDPTPPSWLPYFMTPDCDAMAKKIESLGGRLIVPPTNIPTSGRFAVASDPAGAFFAVYQES